MEFRNFVSRKQEKISGSNDRSVVGRIFRIDDVLRSRWRDFRDVDNCVCFIGDFHVIARGPNFIYTRRKVRARYYLDLLQSELEFPLQMRLACQRLFQCELQRSRFAEIFKYVTKFRTQDTCNIIWEIYLFRKEEFFRLTRKEIFPQLRKLIVHRSFTCITLMVRNRHYFALGIDRDTNKFCLFCRNQILSRNAITTYMYVIYNSHITSSY